MKLKERRPDSYCLNEFTYKIAYLNSCEFCASIDDQTWLERLEVLSIGATIPELVVVACLIWRGGGVFGLQAVTGKN